MPEKPITQKKFADLTDEERRQVTGQLGLSIRHELTKLWLPSFDEAYRQNQKIAEQFASAIKSSHDAFLQTSQQLRAPIGFLADHGWYLSLDLPINFSVTIANLYTEGRDKEVDDQMNDFYKKAEREIEKRILSMYPLRSHILKAAFSAHRRREYELSIPAMLTQVDGICSELIGTLFFKGHNKRPASAAFADQFLENVLLSSLLEPLRRTGQISADTREAPPSPGEFNRHGILHGQIVDYGNRTNSFKVISLLSFLTETVRRAVESREKTA
jgi:hypothetical protein